MLPRELVANWLLTVVANYFTRSERFQFTTDPRGGNGVIYDTETREAVWTEHIIVRGAPGSKANPETQILEAVAHKLKKGPSYAKGKTLIVFMYSGGDGTQWWPDKVAAALPKPIHFEAAWVVGFQSFDGDDRIYAVTRLDLRRAHAPGADLAPARAPSLPPHPSLAAPLPKASARPSAGTRFSGVGRSNCDGGDVGGLLGGRFHPLCAILKAVA